MEREVWRRARDFVESLLDGKSECGANGQGEEGEMSVDGRKENGRVDRMWDDDLHGSLIRHEGYFQGIYPNTHVQANTVVGLLLPSLPLPRKHKHEPPAILHYHQSPNARQGNDLVIPASCCTLQPDQHVYQSCTLTPMQLGRKTMLGISQSGRRQKTGKRGKLKLQEVERYSAGGSNDAGNNRARKEGKNVE